MNLKDKLDIAKIAVSAIAGAGTIYALRESGLSDLMNQGEILKSSVYGEWSKNLAETIVPYLAYFRDGAMGFAISTLVYAGLNFDKFK